MIIAQLSDPHITYNDSTIQPNGSSDALQRAVAHLMRLPVPPDVVLVTGDCVNTGSVSEYAQFRTLLDPLPMPVYVVPGNHDNREQMLAAFGPQGATPLPGFVQYVVDLNAVRLIALDTHVPGSDAGYLCAERLEWLDARLAEASERPTIIFMHHPPFRIGLAVTDQIGLDGNAAFGAIIARHPQIERIVAGHLHMFVLQRFHGTLAATCPSTANALLPDLSRPERLSVIMQPPACLLHVWQPSTGFVTYVSTIGDHGPLVDLHDGTRWLS